MARRVIAALLLAVVTLSACASRSEVESLEKKVANLEEQAALQELINKGLQLKVSDARAIIRGLRACVSEVHGVVDDVADATAYVANPSRVIFGGSVDRFYAFDCKGVVSKGVIKGFRKSVARANRAVDRAFDSSLDSLLGPSNSGVTAVCNDGTSSYSQHASGTCSWHGGVDHWVNYPGN